MERLAEVWYTGKQRKPDLCLKFNDFVPNIMDSLQPAAPGPHLRETLKKSLLPWWGKGK